MPQIRKIEDDVLLDRLAETFKDVGYEGASLSVLSDATGLKKSSLYHRFPDGKAQMAQEVMAQTARDLCRQREKPGVHVRRRPGYVGAKAKADIGLPRQIRDLTNDRVARRLQNGRVRAAQLEPDLHAVGHHVGRVG